jgi:hypothetical protein
MTSDTIDPRAEPDCRIATLATSPASELAANAEEMLALTQAAELAGAEPCDRLRAWRHVGDAFLAIGRAHDKTCLQRAAIAYRNAEALLDDAEACPTERVHLLDGHGRALLLLAEDEDVDLAAAAAQRLALALALARLHQPERVACIKLELCRAEHVIAMRRMAAISRTLYSEVTA